MECGAVAERPVDRKPGCPGDLEAAALRTLREVRHHLRSTHFEQGPVERMPLGVPRLRDLGPVELGRKERRFGARVGNRVAHLRVAEPRERGKLPAPPFAHRGGELGSEIAEEEERRACRELLAHEKHRHRRPEQEAGHAELERGRIGDRCQPFADRAVAYLVVGLQEIDECALRQAGSGVAARAALPETGRFALVPEPLCKGPPEPPHRPVGVVGVVAVALAGGQEMYRVMEVVVPLAAGKARLPAFVAREIASLVAVVFEHDVHVSFAARAGAHCGGELFEEVRGARVLHRMHRIQAQAVEVELLEPVERVVDEEVAHRARMLSVEVERRAPGRMPRLVEELRRVLAEVIPLRAEMVVDHVEQHHQAAGMGGGHQALQVLRRAVGGIGRVRQHAVVAPIAPAGTIGERQKLDRGNAEPREVIEAPDGGIESPFGGKSADMQLVDHGLMPRAAFPVRIRPGERHRIDHHARGMHILGIPARSGVGHADAVVDAVLVGRTCLEALDGGGMPAAAHRCHRQARAAARVGEVELDLARRGRPQPEAGIAVYKLGAERHAMQALHRRASRSTTIERPCSG